MSRSRSQTAMSIELHQVDRPIDSTDSPACNAQESSNVASSPVSTLDLSRAGNVEAVTRHGQSTNRLPCLESSSLEEITPRSTDPRDCGSLRTVVSAFGRPGNHLEAVHKSIARQYTLSGFQILMILIPASATVVSSVFQVLQYVSTVNQGPSQDQPLQTRMESGTETQQKISTCPSHPAAKNESLAHVVKRNFEDVSAAAFRASLSSKGQVVPFPFEAVLLFLLLIAIVIGPRVQPLFVRIGVAIRKSVSERRPQAILLSKKQDLEALEEIAHSSSDALMIVPPPTSVHQGVSSRGLSSSIHRPGQTLKNRTFRKAPGIDRIWDFAFKGAMSNVDELLSGNSDFNINSIDDIEYGTILAAAARGGHEDLVSLLLSFPRIDVHARGGRYFNALQAAAHSGNPTIVRSLLNRGASPSEIGGFHGSALRAAVANGTLDLVKALLPHRPEERKKILSTAGSDNLTPLMSASARGAWDIVKLLLTHGAVPDHRESGGLTALHLAVSSNSLPCTKELVENGAFIDPVSEGNSGTPFDLALQRAIEGADEDLALWLVDRQANVFGRNDEYKTPLHRISNAQHNLKRLAEAVIRRYSIEELNAVDENGCSALHYAAMRGHKETAALLKACGIDCSIFGSPPKDHDLGGEFHKVKAPAYIWAAHFQHREIFQTLLGLNDLTETYTEAGEQAAASPTLDQTHPHSREQLAMILQKVEGNLPRASSINCAFSAATDVSVSFGTNVLLSIVAHINSHSSDEDTVLYSAIMAMSSELTSEQSKTDLLRFVHLLLDHSIFNANDIRPRKSHPDALEAAAAGGHLQIVQRLLDLGAKANRNGYDGVGGVMQAAVIGCNINVLRLLLESACGANIDHEGGFYGSALGAAVGYGSTDMAVMLLQHGANLNVRNRQNETPLQAAIKTYDVEMVRLLLAYDPADISEALRSLRETVMKTQERGSVYKRKEMAGMMRMFNDYRRQKHMFGSPTLAEEGESRVKNPLPA